MVGRNLSPEGRGEEHLRRQEGGRGWPGSDSWRGISQARGPEGESIWGRGQPPTPLSLFPPSSWQCCRLMLGKVVDEQWVGAPTSAEPSSIPAAQVPAS